MHTKRIQVRKGRTTVVAVVCGPDATTRRKGLVFLAASMLAADGWGLSPPWEKPH